MLFKNELVVYMAENSMHKINVSVVFALADKQWLYESLVVRGTSVQELIEQSGFLNDIELLQNKDVDSLDIGIYAQRVKTDTLLEEGDRVEIYRPLTADPKEVRRQLALIGKTIGNK